MIAILRAGHGELRTVAASLGVSWSAACRLRSSSSRRGLRLRHALGIPMRSMEGRRWWSGWA